MMTNRSSTPRVRTPVRSSSVTMRPSPATTGPSRAAPLPPAHHTALRANSPRTAIVASSPDLGRRGSSPATKSLVPTHLSGSTHRNSSPSSRVVTPLRVNAPPLPLGRSVDSSTPMGRASNGVVVSPRMAASHTRNESPMRGRLSNPTYAPQGVNNSRGPSPHTRETSAAQKAQLKKEHDEMSARVGELMAMKRAPLLSDNSFRIDPKNKDDLRVAHLERIKLDPENCGSKRTTNQARCKALATHMAGIIGSSPVGTPRNRPDLGDAVTRGKIQYSASKKSTDLICGSNKIVGDERSASQRREIDSARRVRGTSASDAAPWSKGPTVASPVSQRSHSANRPSRQSPIAFDPKAPIPPMPVRASSALYRHHDVYGEPGRDARAVIVTPDRVHRMKNVAVIKQEMAAEPPMALPPRKKPSLKASPNSHVDSDIFHAPYGDPAACVQKPVLGKRIIDTLSIARSRTPVSGDPNRMNTSDVVPVKGKRTLSPYVVLAGSAGVRSEDPLHSPDMTRRRANAARNESSLDVDSNGLQSSRGVFTTTPNRRHVQAIASTAANAPFGTDSNEWQDSRPAKSVTIRSMSNSDAAGRDRLSNALSPSRYASPAERARGAKNQGFYGKPKSSLKDIFSWE